MTYRPAKINWLEECGRRRHLDEIFARHIERAVAADADVGAGRADQRLGLRQDQMFVDRLRRRRDFGRKIRALIRVKDGESFKERDGVGFFAGLGRALAFAPGDEAVGIDSRGAFLAFVDMAVMQIFA
jgi:hypothetical protein